jgi:hypothetical protein
MVFSEPQNNFPKGQLVCARAMTESAALGEFAVMGWCSGLRISFYPFKGVHVF